MNKIEIKKKTFFPSPFSYIIFAIKLQIYFYKTILIKQNKKKPEKRRIYENE